ncbi:hypothetical protein SEA_BRUHMOMENT_62 [Arthrobacter phage BruhMoment]|nr:hypothetical protein SEA_BRUHMOMENT_62 [Arthrobacter phage BruhMoment]
MSYIELPEVTGSAATRIEALRESKELLEGEALQSSAGAFGSSKKEYSLPGASELIRLATYIETGHDYRDTHPEGKRRPKITNVTVVAPVGANPGQLEHFLEHVKDGSFLEFLGRMKKAEGVDVDDLIADLLGGPEEAGDQPEEGEKEESPRND